MKKRLASTIAAVSLTAGVALSVGACSSDTLDWQCATATQPAISVDPTLCERGSYGFRWYGAHISQLGAYPEPMYGQPIGRYYYETDTRRYRPSRTTRTVTVAPRPTPSKSTASRATPTRAATKTR